MNIQEQKELLFNCLVMLKGSAETNLIDLPVEKLLDILETECASTMDIFWNLVDENKKLKEIINNNF
jgi:hypothetical protein